MKNRIPASLYLFASGGVLVGVVASALWSSEAPRWPGPFFTELQELTRLEPIRVLPRVEMSLVALEARSALEAGRPWSAWRLLADHVEAADAMPGYVLLAARAAADWQAWDHVRDALEGRDWLERAEGGEGLFLLGRAYEGLGKDEEAAEAYARYTALPSARSAGSAWVRLGRVLTEANDPAAAANAYAHAAAALPEVADWLRTLQVEAMAAAGDPRTIALAASTDPLSPPVRVRRVEAEVAVRDSSGDVAGALRKLEWEEKVLRAQHAPAEAARLKLARGRLLVHSDRDVEARDVLRAVAWDAGALPAVRADAAALLGEMKGTLAADELARAAAYEAAGRPGLSARSLRAATATGAADGGGVQLKLGRLLYEERDYGPARAAFRRAAEALREPELAAEAALYAARALYRTGSHAAALAEMRQVVDRYPGTAAAGSAHFLLGDASSSLESALASYRRAAAIESSPDAREALFRVGDRSLKLKDPAGAIKAWEEYVRRYPRGDATAQVAYETGRLHEKTGRDERARAMYEAAIEASPVSYYALRAGSRLGEHPVDRILAEQRPWVGLASDPAAGEAVLRRLDVLEQVGLKKEWEQELASARRTLAERPVALLTLAEGLRDREHPVEGITIGWRLLDARGGIWDPRLLRVVFPFPYRGVVEAEADRADIDPMLLAGLIRQESSFRADAESWVGATGLSQIMPSTGRWLASSLHIRDFEPRLLKVPEVNVRMGARYLGDQLHAYDGARDLALAAYNAGPGRASRWKRELHYGRDTDAFREAIPFDETRAYVKIVLRNAGIYARLYDTDRPVGLVLEQDP